MCSIKDWQSRQTCPSTALVFLSGVLFECKSNLKELQFTTRIVWIVFFYLTGDVFAESDWCWVKLCWTKRPVAWETPCLRRSDPHLVKTGELGVDSAPLDVPEDGDGGAKLLQLPAAGECSRNCGNLSWKPEKSDAPGLLTYGVVCLSGQLSSDTVTVSNRSEGIRIYLKIF